MTVTCDRFRGGHIAEWLPPGGTNAPGAPDLELREYKSYKQSMADGPADKITWLQAAKMKPHEFWQLHGGHSAPLRPVALKVLTFNHDHAAGNVERN